MAGTRASSHEIVQYKKEYGFRLFVDDAHGFGTVGENGRGAGDEQGVHEEIDVYFGTFAKAMATIGAFVAGPQDVIDFLRYNMRSQTFAKSLPMPLVIGAIKRLEMMATQPEHKEKLWTVASALQKGLREAGFDIGDTNSCVTPVFLKGGLGEATNLTFDLRENYGIFCSIVVYPVVLKDVIMPASFRRRCTRWRTSTTRSRRSKGPDQAGRRRVRRGGHHRLGLIRRPWPSVASLT